MQTQSNSIHIVIAGHGHYASGTKSTLELIAGPQAGIDYWDFGHEWQYDDLLGAMQKLLAERPSQPLLFLCDIVGGTPFKVAAESTYGRPAAAVVAGANVSAIIEVVLQREFHALDALAALAISETRGTVAQFAVPSVVVQQPSEGI